MVSNRSNVLFWRSAKQATIYKWLSRFWLRCNDVHMRRKMVTDSWYSSNNRLTVGDVHRTLTLCKQKETSALCATNGDRNTSNRLLDLLFAANKVRTFRNYQLCLFQLNIAQDMWCLLKYMSNRKFKFDNGWSNIFIFNILWKALVSLTVICPKKFLQESVDHPSAIQPPEA